MIEFKTLETAHVVAFHDWLRDPEVIKYSLSIFQKMETNAQIDLWYFDLIENSKSVNYGIFLKENNQFVGYCGLCNLSEANSSGEYFIFIGDKQQWGKGISTQATQKLLHIGFNQLNLNRIMLTVSQPNVGAAKSYLKAGFKEEGILREACFRDDQFHDKIIMSVLKKEWGNR